jgi:hypothetical protein
LICALLSGRLGKVSVPLPPCRAEGIGDKLGLQGQEYNTS